MTTLLPPPAPDPTAAPPVPTTPAAAPTAPGRRSRRSRWDRLWHWLAVTGAAAGATSVAFGAPVSPLAVSRMLRYPTPDDPPR